MEHSASLPGFPHLDKIIHATLFAALTAVGYCAYAKYSIWLYIGLAAYGILTELSQGAFTTTRYASVYDWLADLTGILLCILAIKIIQSQTIIKTPYAS